jgi:hypothetical protein
MIVNNDIGNEFENIKINTNTNEIKDDDGDITIIKELVVTDEIPSQTTTSSPISTVYSDILSSFSPMNSDNTLFSPTPDVITSIGEPDGGIISDIISTIDTTSTADDSPVDSPSTSSGLFTAAYGYVGDENVADARNLNIGRFSDSNENSFTVEKDESNNTDNSDSIHTSPATISPITPTKGPYNSDYCLDLAAIYPVSPVGPYSSRTVKPSSFK